LRQLEDSADAGRADAAEEGREMVQQHDRRCFIDRLDPVYLRRLLHDGGDPVERSSTKERAQRLKLVLRWVFQSAACKGARRSPKWRNFISHHGPTIAGR
jgi:hypothetical protein